MVDVLSVAGVVFLMFTGFIAGIVTSLFLVRKVVSKKLEKSVLVEVMFYNLLSEFKIQRKKHFQPNLLIIGKRYAILVDVNERVWKVKNIEHLTEEEKNATFKINMKVIGNDNLS